ncbi:MAG: MFS transporter [Acidobacteriota bacterium]|jgi:MFS family permease
MSDFQPIEETAAPPEAAAAPGFGAALRERNFALLWAGQSLSAVGNFMLPVALATLVMARGGGATGLGLVLGLHAFSIAVGTGAAAAVGDRWSRARVMIFADVIRALGVGCLAFAPMALTDPTLLGLVALIGIGEGLFQPAFSAAVPRVLPEELLQPGNGLNALSLQGATVLGPALAGVMVATLGVGPALWIDAGTFVFSVGTLVAIREAAVAAPAETAPGVGGAVRRLVDDLKEGLQAVWFRPWIAATVGVATVVMVFVTAPSLVVLPLEAEARLGGADAYGAVLAAMGVGAVLGSLVGGRIRTRRTGVVALSGTLTIAVAVGGLALLPFAGVLVAWAIGGAGVTVFQVLWNTALQKDVPDRVLVRVMALNTLAVQGLMPFGYAVAGPLVERFGTQPVLLVGVALVVVVTPLPLLAPGGITFSSRS